jgi:hypothetical protein
MADSITPVRVAAIPFPVVGPPDRTRRKGHRGIRIGLVASEILSLTALLFILLPMVGQLRWFQPSGMLAGWPELRDAHATCQQFLRQWDSLRNRARTVREAGGGWSWTRLDDGRFRIVGHSETRTNSGALRRARYQCDLAPLTSSGRWRVDSLVVTRERPS